MSTIQTQPAPLSRTESEFLAQLFESRWSEIHGTYYETQERFLSAAGLAEGGDNALCNMIALHSFGVFAYETESWPLAEHLFLELRGFAEDIGHRYCEAIALMWLAKISEAHGAHGQEELEQAADLYESIGEIEKARQCRDASSDSFWKSMIQLLSPAEPETDPEDDFDE